METVGDLPNGVAASPLLARSTLLRAFRGLSDESLVGIYVTVSILYIVLSDAAMFSLGLDATLVQWLGIWKGAGFVVMSGVGLAWLLYVRRAADRAHFQSLFDRHYAVLLLIDADDGTIVDANRRAVEFYGWPRERLRSMRIMDFADVTVPHWRAEGEHARQGERGRTRFVHRLAHGEFRQVNVLHGPVEQGDRAWLLAVVQDVTEHNRTMKALRESEALRRALVESSPLPIVSLRPDGTVMTWNAAATRIFGWSALEANGATAPFLPREQDHFFGNLLKGALAGERAEGIELACTRKNGGPLDVRLSLAPIRDVEGQVHGVIVTGEDVSDRRKADMALRDSEDRYRSLFHNGHTAMLLVDPAQDGRIVDANPAAASFYGWSREELRAMTIGEISDEFDPLWLGRVDEAAATEPAEFEFRHRGRDGRVRAVDVYGGRIKVDGKPLVYCIVHDATERREALEQLALSARRAQAMIDLPVAAERLGEAALLQHALEMIERLTHSRAGFVYRPDADRQSLRLVEWSRRTEMQFGADWVPPRVAIGGPGLVSRAYCERTPLSIDDIAEGPLEPALPDRLDRLLVVPVVNGGNKVELVIGLANKPAAYGAMDLETARLLGGEAWRLIRNKRDEQALRASEERYREIVERAPDLIFINRGDRIHYINPAGVSMIGAESAEALVGRSIYEIFHPQVHPLVASRIERLRRQPGMIAPIATETIVARDGSTILADTTAVSYVADDGVDIQVTCRDMTARRQAERERDAAERKFRALVEQSLVGVFMLDEHSIQYANPRAAEMFGYDPGEVEGMPFLTLIADSDREAAQCEVRSLLTGEKAVARIHCTGIRKNGAQIIIGAQGVAADLGGERRIMGVVQDVTDMQRAERMLAEYIGRLEASVFATANAVSQIVELRDPYTAGHQHRVGDLAAAIAREMGLSADFQKGLRVAGAVHDVGKILLPGEILSKPGVLSEVEFELVKQHSAHGYEVLKDVPFPWPIAEVARQHHERYDGSGYPGGLKGDEILLEARIVAVADVVESMASHRPYRPALGIDAALREIEDRSGTRYDAAVVAACVRLFRERGYALIER